MATEVLRPGKLRVICPGCGQANRLERAVLVGEEFTIICVGCETAVFITRSEWAESREVPRVRQ